MELLKQFENIYDDKKIIDKLNCKSKWKIKLSVIY